MSTTCSCGFRWPPSVAAASASPVGSTHLGAKYSARSTILPTSADLFAQERKLFGLTLGAEHELDAFDGKLENVLFVKDYVQKLSANATTTLGTVSPEQTQHRVGIETPHACACTIR